MPEQIAALSINSRLDIAVIGMSPLLKFSARTTFNLIRKPVASGMLVIFLE